MNAAKKIVMIVVCLMLCGCQTITFSVEGLLSAPNVADEQSAIYQALIESVGRGITLEYPRGGDYRSAFVLADIDGDDEQETLAFYSVSSVNDSNVKVSVLDRDTDGNWHAMYELAGVGVSVDRVMFSETKSGQDIIIGYSAQDYEENAVRMYRYNSGVLNTIYEGTYSVMEKGDLDGCGSDEIAIVKRSGLGVVAEVLKASDNDSYLNYSLELDIGASGILDSMFGRLGNVSALYLDISYDGGGILSEILYLGESGLVGAISSGGMLMQTFRPAGYPSADYDGDGIVEIPALAPFLGYTYAAWGEAEYMTLWQVYNPETSSLEVKSNAYYNYDDGYVITIPNRWLNMVTVSKDRGTGEVTFYRYDPQCESVAGISPIISFASSDSSGGGAFEATGYTVLKETDLKKYYVLTRAGAGETLVLTLDEIRDNFHIIEK